MTELSNSIASLLTRITILIQAKLNKFIKIDRHIDSWYINIEVDWYIDK